MTTAPTGPVPEGKVRCQITGNLVNPDEIVAFQGHQVCAEGKAILLERLRSGDLGPGQVRRPTILRRFSAMFVDGLILGIINYLIGLAIGMGMIASAAGGDARARTHVAFEAQLVALLIGSALVILYFTGMHGSSGQSLGKMAAKLKVVNMDGGAISMKTACWRAVAYHWPSLMSIFGLLALFMITQPEAIVMIVGAISIINGLWGLANLITALVDTSQQRALHDRLAGTRVIQLD